MLYIIYVHYGKGVTFRTGPENARFRQGLWSHVYRKQHPHCSGCMECLQRVSLGPTARLPEGRQAGIMYKMTGGAS